MRININIVVDPDPEKKAKVSHRKKEFYCMFPVVAWKLLLKLERP